MNGAAVLFGGFVAPIALTPAAGATPAVAAAAALAAGAYVARAVVVHLPHRVAAAPPPRTSA